MVSFRPAAPALDSAVGANPVAARWPVVSRAQPGGVLQPGAMPATYLMKHRSWDLGDGGTGLRGSEKRVAGTPAEHDGGGNLAELAGGHDVVRARAGGSR